MISCEKLIEDSRELRKCRFQQEVWLGDKGG
jgi:hypothetical protein